MKEVIIKEENADGELKVLKGRNGLSVIRVDS